MQHPDLSENLVRHKLDALVVFNSAFDEFGAALEKFNQSLALSCSMMKTTELKAKEFQVAEEEKRTSPF